MDQREEVPVEGTRQKLVIEDKVRKVRQEEGEIR